MGASARPGRPDGLFEGRGRGQRGGPIPEYVRFATHYGFRPDFCESADPESKGMVEHLGGYAKRDVIAPQARSMISRPGTLLRALLVK